MEISNGGRGANFYHSAPGAGAGEQQRKKAAAITIGAISLAVVGIVLLAVYSQTGKNKYAKEAVEIAQLNNSGDYAGAQKLLEEKLKADSAPELELMLANSYLDEGSVRGQEAAASKKAQDILIGLEVSYQSVYLYDLLGYSYEIINDFDNTLLYYDKSLSLDKKSVNTLFSIGHTYWLKGETDKARDYYAQAESAITPGTDNSVKIKVYAGVAMLSKDLAVAEKYFLKTIAISESRAFKAEIYADLANLKLVQRENAQALKYAKMALEADSSSEMAHLAFAKSAMAEKGVLEAYWKEVRLSLFRAIFLAPTKAEPQYWQGKLEFIGGRYDQAIRSYRNALKLLPKDNSLNADSRRVLESDINFDIAVAYYLKNDKENAYQFLRESFSGNPVKVMYVLEKSERLQDLLAMLTDGK